MTDKKTPNEFFITRRADKRYNVERPNSKRPSAVTDTQRHAIDRAKERIRRRLVISSEFAAIPLGPTNFARNNQPAAKRCGSPRPSS